MTQIEEGIGDVKGVSVGRNDLVLVAGSTGTIGLFRWAAPELEKVAVWHGALRNLQTAALAWDTDHDYLMAGGPKRPMNVWRVEGTDFGEYLHHRDGGLCLYAENSRNQSLAVAGSLRGIDVRRIATGHKVETPRLPCQRVIALAYSKSDRQVFMVNEFRAQVLDWTHKDVHWNQLLLDGTDFIALTVAVSGDGQWVAVGGPKAPVMVCRANQSDFPLYAVLGSSKDTIGHVAFDHRSRLLAVVPRVGDVLLWNTADWTLAGRLPVPSDAHIIAGAMSFSNDDRVLAAGTDDGKILLWDMVNLIPKGTLRADEDVWTMAFDADGRHLVTGGRNGSVSLWDVAGKRRLTKWLGHDAGIAKVVFQAGESQVFLTCALDGEIRLWRLDRIRAELRSMALDW